MIFFSSGATCVDVIFPLPEIQSRPRHLFSITYLGTMPKATVSPYLGRYTFQDI